MSTTCRAMFIDAVVLFGNVGMPTREKYSGAIFPFVSPHKLMYCSNHFQNVYIFRANDKYKFVIKFIDVCTCNCLSDQND